MGQITAKIYQKSCVYDFSVNGGAASQKDLGIAINGGESLVSIYYSIVTPLATAAVNIDAGFQFLGGTGFVSHTVAELNAAVGTWLLPVPPAGFPFKIAVGSVQDTRIMFTPGAFTLTAGVMIFSFTIFSSPL